MSPHELEAIRQRVAATAIGGSYGGPINCAEDRTTLLSALDEASSENERLAALVTKYRHHHGCATCDEVLQPPAPQAGVQS